jgi:tetratricopeptide (TPR) repeat protein
VNITEAFVLAQQQQQAGSLLQAVDLYRQILEADPANVPVLQGLATAYGALGDLPNLTQCFRQLAGLTPDQAEAHYRLGVALMKEGKPVEAAAAFERTLNLQPNRPEVQSNLGVARHAQGELEAAIAWYRRALTSGPDHPVVRNYLGLALRDHGKLDEAAACYQRALQLNPDYPDAYFNLGDVLFRQDDFAGAAAAYGRAVSLRPDHVDAHCHLGAALNAQGQAGEAAACYRRALELGPNRPQTCVDLGDAFYALEDLAGAEAAYRRALSLDAQCAEAHNGLAYVMEHQGRTQQAVEHATAALGLRPDWTEPLSTLAGLAANGYCDFPESQAERLKTLAANANLAPSDASRLHFALAQLHERRGAYDDAFAAYRQANALQQRLARQADQAFDARAHDEVIDGLIAAFGARFFGRTHGFGLDTETPVFIVGMPRSGTTLVEQILSRHPQVFAAGETNDGGRLVARLPELLGGAEGYPRCIERLDPTAARTLAGEYLQAIAARSGDAARVTDKSPLNYLYLGLLAALFPRARVIHCRRDPRDVCLSCYFQYFGRAGFAWDLGDAGRYYRTYQRLMDHWRDVLPVHPLEVVYEDLVAHQEAVSRQMVAFCGLPWDERCLTFYESRRPVHTASKLQVRRPIYATSVGRWRRYEKHLKPLLDALGFGGGSS